MLRSDARQLLDILVERVRASSARLLLALLRGQHRRRPLHVRAVRRLPARQRVAARLDFLGCREARQHLQQGARLRLRRQPGHQRARLALLQRVRALRLLAVRSGRVHAVEHTGQRAQHAHHWPHAHANVDTLRQRVRAQHLQDALARALAVRQLGRALALLTERVRHSRLLLPARGAGRVFRVRASLLARLLGHRRPVGHDRDAHSGHCGAHAARHVGGEPAQAQAGRISCQRHFNDSQCRHVYDTFARRRRRR